MFKNLQHVIRDFATRLSNDEQFTGEINVSLNIQDPDYDRAQEGALVDGMDDMFAYLTNQLRAILEQGGREKPISLSYSFVK
jgi:hypothetical protein